jgi:HK97 gp10 family phage protein
MRTRKPSRMEVNYAALEKAQQAVASGVLALGESVARHAAADAPVSDDPRYGHVKDQWGAAVYVNGKKVGDVSADGSAVAKPREFRAARTGVSGIVGFGFPARFVEVGTSDTPAQPFLSPAAQAADVAVVADGASAQWPRGE